MVLKTGCMSNGRTPGTGQGHVGVRVFKCGESSGVICHGRSMDPQKAFGGL